MNDVKQYFQAVGNLIRPLNSIHPLALVYIGGLIIQAPIPLLIGSLILYFVVHSAVTLSNDLNDIAVDAANGRNVESAKRVSSMGGVWLVRALYLGSIAMSILYFPSIFTVILVALLVISWSYNAKPLQLSKRPIGSMIALGICYGLLPFLAGVALHSSITLQLLLLGVGFALSRASLSILKDYKDVAGDARHHKKTFLLVFGRTIVRRVSVASAIAGYALIVTCIAFMIPDGQQAWVGSVVATAIAVWLVLERVKLAPVKSYQQLNGQFHRLLSYEVLFYGGIILWVSTSLV